MAFTSKDVARAVGVSQSTVSYVMSGKRPISQETRDRFLSAIEQLRYQPYPGARALAGRRTDVIGLVVPFPDSADVSGLLPFIQTICEVAREHDYDVVLLVTVDEESAGLKRLAGKALCDAIVLMDVEAADERVPVAASLGVPVVLVGIPDDPAGLHRVDIDFAQAARTAVQALADTGHDRLTVIGFSASVMQRGINFVHRFMDSAKEAARGLALPLEVLAPVEPGRAAAAAVVDRLLAGERGRRHDSSCRETRSSSLCCTRSRRGESCPGATSPVIGHCTDQAAEESDLPVSNVSFEPRSESRRAMETLFWLLDPVPGEPPPQVSLVPTRLTHRATTMPPVDLAHYLKPDQEVDTTEKFRRQASSK